MTSDEYQWEVKLVQDRYHTFQLTYEQAEAVYKFEKEKDAYSEKHYFSVWEEWDFELVTFRQILNQSQLADYEKSVNDNIQRYEQHLRESDKAKENEIAYAEEVNEFYETQFLPAFFKDPLLLVFAWLPSAKTKIDYLKAEYSRYLGESKKDILVSHFRHNRAFKPNELKAALLRHRRSAIWPDYSSFKYQLDDATKAVATHLASKLKYLPEKLEILLAKKLEEAKLFHEAVLKKYYGEPNGWRVTIGELPPDEQREHRVMPLFLLDENKYGY